MPPTTITVMLNVNDERGNHTGRVNNLHIGDCMELEGYFTDWRANPTCSHGKYHLRVGRFTYRIAGYREYVGNIMWDAAKMELSEASRLVNDLRKTGKFTCTMAVGPLHEKYESGELFTAEDFAEAAA
jgi:hypothetical protein